MRDESKKILGIHAGVVLAELICASAFIFELRRATGGNQLSWAYVFEWPILGLYGIYVWRKLLHEERHGVDAPRAPREADQDDEAARIRYNDYLRHVHDLARGDDASQRD